MVHAANVPGALGMRHTALKLLDAAYETLARVLHHCPDTTIKTTYRLQHRHIKYLRRQTALPRAVHLQMHVQSPLGEDEQALCDEIWKEIQENTI